MCVVLKIFFFFLLFVFFVVVVVFCPEVTLCGWRGYKSSINKQTNLVKGICDKKKKVFLCWGAIRLKVMLNGHHGGDCLACLLQENKFLFQPPLLSEVMLMF